MGTVINLRFPAVAADRCQRPPRPKRRSLRWSPEEAARAWWEMTLIKSTLETMCELAQHAVREAGPSGEGVDPELQAAFGLGTSDPHHIRVRSLPPEIAVIHPVFRDASLHSRETAAVALRLIEQAVRRFSDAIDCLSATIDADGIARSARKEMQFAAETAALTRLQILQQSEEAIRSQAGGSCRGFTVF